MTPDTTHTQRDPPRNPGYGDTEWHAAELAEAMKERLAKENEQEQQDHGS